ncbi:hypothetical protein BX666DRAFT_463787 [Dichotomocladium elegans]|nr:hypothetical protein BX666DRAFT_463787 [Dichotomocladium elegans]
MSQLKASPPPQAQSAFSLPHSQELHTTSRIMTRRASRSAHSSVSNQTSVVQENDMADSESAGRMTTRSRSADLNPQASNLSPAEESSSSNASGTTSSTTTATSPHHASNGTSSRRQNLTQYQQQSSHGRAKRVTKPSTSLPVRRRRGGGGGPNAKETKATSGTMDALRQQKLAQLDELEKSILDGTHQEYRERMAHAEKKRMDQIRIAQVRRNLQEIDIRSAFDARTKAAHDNFHQSRAALRLSMIGRVQAEIKRLEEEWQARNSNCIIA